MNLLNKAQDIIDGSIPLYGEEGDFITTLNSDTEFYIIPMWYKDKILLGYNIFVRVGWDLMFVATVDGLEEAKQFLQGIKSKIAAGATYIQVEPYQGGDE